MVVSLQVHWVILRRPEFAFLLQLGEQLIDNGEQLEDDGGGDVRHDAEGEDGEAARRLPPVKEVSKAGEELAF